VSDNEGVTSTNMVFTLSYSFKAKPDHLACFKNDCEDNAKEKHKSLRSTSQSQLSKKSRDSHFLCQHWVWDAIWSIVPVYRVLVNKLFDGNYGLINPRPR
jgi:hypothetical protein